MVKYEWDVEIVSAEDTPFLEKEEVIDHRHCVSYKEAVLIASGEPDPGTEHRIVLVRDDDEGRSWAYMDEGKLPDEFEDAGGTCFRMPKRFKEEVARL